MTGAIIRRGVICAVAVGLLFIPHTASAQNGSIKGKVADAQGTPVEGAVVEIQSLDKGGKPLQVKTKKDGSYMQVGLSPGQYKVTASKEDLSDSRNVRISLDMTIQDFKLTKGGGMTGGDAAKAKAKAEAANKAFSEGVALSNEGRDLATQATTLSSQDKSDDAAAKSKEATAKYDEAVAKFQEVIAQIPNCAECYANIGTVQSNAKKYDEAEAAYKKAIELKPDMADAYNGLANLYNAQKKFDQAADASKKAMELSGGAGTAAGAAAGGASAAAVFNQGVILWNAGKIPEAKAQFEQAIKLDPNNADAHYWLGMSLVNAGTPDSMKEAKPHFETYLKLAPTGQYVDTAKAIVAQIK
jgi:tetratricopeptide (TPR) repeat protein